MKYGTCSASVVQELQMQYIMLTLHVRNALIMHGTNTVHLVDLDAWVASVYKYSAGKL